MAYHERLGKSDEWYTPQYVFDALGTRFDMDVAAPADTTKICVPAARYLHADSLSADWDGFCWCNPPFGGRNGIEAWLDKMAEHGNGIALAPDRTSAPWWQRQVRRATSVLFVAKKIKFLSPDGTAGLHPGNGTTLFAYGPAGDIALQNAHRSGLGIRFQIPNPA